MASLYPFRALRPIPEAAPSVASVPYDVVSTAEARALVSGNPLSFLRVTRAEVDLPPSTNPYDDQVYAQAVRNFEALKRDAPLVIEEQPSLYLYRLRMGTHEQTGVAGCFSLDEYDSDLIKKHERTRKDKEDDRTKHMLELRAQTGVVFLTYRASASIDRLVGQAAAKAPLFDFVAPDGVAHTMWRLPDAAPFVQGFADLPALYIADGHHRVASAARAREEIVRGGRAAGEAGRFVAVAFPDSQVQILGYHRLVRDLSGSTPEAVLANLRGRMSVTEGRRSKTSGGRVEMFLDGRWYVLALPHSPAGASRADTLDVETLQREVLTPVFGIGDIRTDKRIDFVGGARGTAELERRVSSGEAAAAFALHPVDVADLLTISDAGGIMPPKSTWFEPKLRDGLLTHLI
jgi:uncharacterized protein (DUF1015 family)